MIDFSLCEFPHWIPGLQQGIFQGYCLIYKGIEEGEIVKESSELVSFKLMIISRLAKPKFSKIVEKIVRSLEPAYRRDNL